MHVSINSYIAGYCDKVPVEDQIPTSFERNRKLRDEDRKLYKALCGVRNVNPNHANDNMLRFQYHELKGDCRTSRLSGSKVVLQVAPHFYAYIYPFLHRVYGDKMSQEVMIVCPYAETMAWWEQVIERELRVPTAAHALSGILTPSRKHHPRLLINSDDPDIRSSIVIIDPANQDGTIPGQGTFKNAQVKTAVSRAIEAVLIIGNSCMPYPPNSKTSGETAWVDVESALNAAHMYADYYDGRRLTDEGIELHAVPVQVGEIPEPILFDEERETLVRLLGADYPDLFSGVYFGWRG
jgi:hypothetical protein